MIFYFVALSTASLLVLIPHLHKETNRWAAFFLFSASIGGLTGLLRQNGFTELAHAAEFINHTLTPYGVLVFSLVYSGVLENNPRARRLAKGLLLLPVPAMLMYTAYKDAFAIHYGPLLLWTAPYYLSACWLLVLSLRKERNPVHRRNRLITTLIIVPTLLGVLLFINVARVFSPAFDFFGYVSVFILYSFAVALLCVFVYGVLGIRLRFERDSLDTTMQAVTSGTTLLNHSIKNELGKISLSTVNLQESLGEKDAEVKEHLRIIASASDHMLDMVGRIHNRTKEIVLKERPVSIDKLAMDAVRLHERLFATQQITITTSFECRPSVRLDPVHLTEVIGNLLGNAAEAMPDGGTLTVTLAPVRQGAVLSISDTGGGIPPGELPRVFEPFYTTKKKADNYGLGLSYVYNVMQKSGGSVEISSKPGAGTSVRLYFPRSKIVQLNGEKTDGTY
ncbi:sensor histidine kinase [Paenibacillus sp. 1P03SA]|uniref:sensor histidine kinase n=1 Tax=Paenibacillus sp. 1P03SA TaxID=3132294 RepID=UPI0039A19C30